MKSEGESWSIALAGEHLGLTPGGVRRLVRDGALEIKERRMMKYGVELFFNRRDVEALLIRMPKLARKWESEDVFRQGGKKSSLQRVRVERGTRVVKNLKVEFLDTLHEMPEKTARLLRTSFFLFHLNHYAKGGEEYLYELKEDVLKSFKEEFDEENGLYIAFIQGDEKATLCEECRQKAKNRGIGYAEYKDTYGNCPRCRRDRDYYSLYEFIVEWGTHRFIFHTLYRVGKKWFSDTQSLPQKSRNYGKEGGITFGRPITGAEANAVGLAEVIRELERFLGRTG